MPPAAMPGIKVAILGTGKMGGILLQAFLKNNLLHQEQIFATVAHPERAHALSAQYSVEVTTDNLEAARQADVILLGVKPIQVPAPDRRDSAGPVRRTRCWYRLLRP